MKLKNLIAIILAVCLLAPMTVAGATDTTATSAAPAATEAPALIATAPPAPAAVPAGEKRAVIGADLNEEQVAAVYKAFGVNRGEVTEIKVTNADERKYLEGLIDPAKLGTRSISCVYIETLEPGRGTEVTTSNINWCTADMYVSALATAGITDAKIIVAAPFEVSGTAALTGVYLAYENITGRQIDEVAKIVSTQELSVTAELADQIGAYDSVEIVNELKLILEETKQMTDEQIGAEIKRIAGDLGITLSEAQIAKLIDLCRSLEKLDPTALKEKVEGVQDSLKKIAEAKDKVAGFTQKIAEFFASIGDFFARLFGRKATA